MVSIDCREPKTSKSENRLPQPLIFDVEAASFYPWAVQMHQLRMLGLVEMVSFVIVLAIGYAYVWKRGGFVWR